MEKVKEYLLSNMDELESVIRELNAWNGCLEYLEFYDNNEDFFEMFFDCRMIELVRAIKYGDYDFTDEYVRFDGYGNLETLSYHKYRDELKNEIDTIVEELKDNYQHLCLDEELLKLIEEEEEEE